MRWLPRKWKSRCTFPENCSQGKYLLVFDPLDGSSNTDVNMPLGSIFSVLRHQRGTKEPLESDLIQGGTEQVAAGIYHVWF